MDKCVSQTRTSLRAGWFCSLVKLLSFFYHVGKNEAEVSWGVWEMGGGGPVISALLALTFDLAIAKYMLRSINRGVIIYRSLKNTNGEAF